MSVKCVRAYAFELPSADGSCQLSYKSGTNIFIMDTAWPIRDQYIHLHRTVNKKEIHMMKFTLIFNNRKEGIFSKPLEKGN